ncbi:MAG: hypothetical protein CFE25_03545 [Chitinophagaceae bacterium BSSC1]|nr:MAG: hypothetical protein CFE25_03545 [Chitinophagaceae bacterium BSSC1]
MDELKKYLQNHRDQLGDDAPSPKIWTGISESLEPAVTPVFRIGYRWAAAAILLLIAGAGLWYWNQPNQPTQELVKEIKQPVLPTVEPSLVDTIERTITAALTKPAAKAKDIQRGFPAATPITTIHTVSELSNNDLVKMASLESSFTQVINLQKARISTTPLYAESPSYFKDFKLQMQQMEKDEKQIKVFISKNGMTDELLDQLINVYQQKLTMLKQLQNEMQKLNTRYKQNRESVDTAKTYFLNL